MDNAAHYALVHARLSVFIILVGKLPGKLTFDSIIYFAWQLASSLLTFPSDVPVLLDTELASVEPSIRLCQTPCLG